MHGVRLRKSLGQNFLGDPVWLNRIVAAAGVAAQDTVLEIGAGAGSLTRPLAQAAQRVLAVEIDGRLLAVLRAVLAGLPMCICTTAIFWSKTWGGCWH